MSFTIQSRRGAFTLVEVILAILIISGIMSVLLYFYQRAAEVRKAALDETEFISTARLVMEQITSELRTARLVPDQGLGLEGSSNSISFICTALPPVGRWLASTNEPVVSYPATDLKRVHYNLLAGTNLLETLGLERSERSLLASSSFFETNILETNAAPEIASTNADPVFLESSTTNDLFSTNQTPTLPQQPLTDQIRFLQFRYWDGKEWLETWSGLDLPVGVEVTVGREPMPMDSNSEGYPYEVFRRVIYLPQSEHPGNRVMLEEEVGL